MAPLLYELPSVLTNPFRVVIVVAVLLGGCTVNHAGTTASGPTPSASDRGVPLPTTGFMDSCAGEELFGRITLTARGQEVVALVGGAELPLTWPAHFAAVFDPDFSKVVRPDGSTFAVASEDITAVVADGVWHEENVCGTARGIFVYPNP